MEAQTEVWRAHGERKRERESLKEGGKSKEGRHIEKQTGSRERHTQRKEERGEARKRMGKKQNP